MSKVEVCRGQLYTRSGTSIDFSKDPPEPTASWREGCATILGKKVKFGLKTCRILLGHRKNIFG